MDLWAYLIAITLLTLTPGVDTLLVIRNSRRGGWRDGMVSSLGICSGLFVHAGVSAVGISMLLVQSAWAFSLLKLAGAGYLIWLGLSSLKSALGRPDNAGLATPAAPAVANLRRSLLEGLLSNVLNPKTAIFYMAFLPQFIDPTHPPLAQALMLAGLHFLIAMVWLCALALLINRIQRWFERPSVKQGLDGITGSVMILLGAKLALERA